MNLKNTLINLCSLKKVSGEEKYCAEQLKNMISKFFDTIFLTENNSLIATTSEKSKNTKPEIILTAHLDEIGFIVSEICENGYLKLKNCGGIDLNIANFQQIDIFSKKKLTGFTFVQNESKTLLANLGLTKQEIKNLVKIGDRAAFKFNPVFLNNEKFCSKSLDDCVGIAAILMAIEQLDFSKLNYKLTVIFSSQEEISGNGIITSSYYCNADIAICVDVSFAKFLGCKSTNIGEMTKGPLIGVSPILDLELTKKLQKIAEKNKIPYQLEIMNGLTSTDADKVVKIKDGIKTCLISIPIKYMHSPVEQVALEDIENTASLITKFIQLI